MNQFHSRKLVNIICYVCLVIIMIFFFFPLFWIISTAVKPQTDYVAYPPVFISRHPTTAAFSNVLRFSLFPALPNSLIISIVSTFITVFIGSFASYGFVRTPLKGQKNIIFWVLSTRMFPPIVTAIPLYLIFNFFRAIDTHHGLILIYTMFNLPFVMLLMHSFFRTVPKELEEASWIEGCSYFGSFFRVALPLAWPGIIASTILSFVFTWNEFLFALIFTRTRAVTLPPTIEGFHATSGVMWGDISALTIVIIIPVIALCFIVQKHLVRGLTFGALKG